MIPIQKPLSWVQRFLYNSAGGQPLPAFTMSIPIGTDWPLQTEIRTISYATIAGTVSTTIFAPRSGNHGFLISALTQTAAGGNWPATDQIELIQNQSSAPFNGISLLKIQGTAFEKIPLVNDVFIQASVQLSGVVPLYVPNSQFVKIDHFSVAGGVNAIIRLICLEVPESYPLRLP